MVKRWERKWLRNREKVNVIEEQCLKKDGIGLDLYEV